MERVARGVWSACGRGAERTVLEVQGNVSGEERSGGCDGVDLGGGVALAIACRGEEAANMRVSGTLIKGKDGWIVSEEAVVGVKAGTMDGRCGGSVAPGMADACELSLEVELKLVGGVLLNVRGDKGRAMGKAELEGEV